MIHHTLWHPYTQMKTTHLPIEVRATNAEYLILASGEKIIDGVGSWWTNCHGYNHPHIVQAIVEQATCMPHVMLGGITHPQARRLAQRLIELLPSDLNHVFLASTGSESVEIAMKIAIQYWLNQGISRAKFVCFENAYHGDTLYAMSACDPKEGMHHIFQKVLPKQLHHPIPKTVEAFTKFEAWIIQNKHDIAGVIIEPLVQGASGMKMHDSSFLKKLSELCKAHQLLLITDEIFTGFGRTGTLFAIDEASIVPDIVCLSKALTGGTLPLAAVITRTPIYDAFLSEDSDHTLMHGSTFTGHPLACAAANASLDLFEQLPWKENISRMTQHFKNTLSSLEELSTVKEVRILGAIAAVQLHQRLDSTEYREAVDYFMQQGVWLRPLGDVIYTTPNFNIGDSSLETLTRAIRQYVEHRETSYVNL